MLKAANVELAGPMTQVGNALVTAVVVGRCGCCQGGNRCGSLGGQSHRRRAGQCACDCASACGCGFNIASEIKVIPMFLARVEGSVVATKKDPSMNGRRFVILRPQLVDDKDPSKFRPGTNTIVGAGWFWRWRGGVGALLPGQLRSVGTQYERGAGGPRWSLELWMRWMCWANRYTTPGNPPHSLHQAKLCRPSVLARAKLVGRRDVGPVPSPGERHEAIKGIGRFRGF